MFRSVTPAGNGSLPFTIPSYTPGALGQTASRPMNQRPSTMPLQRPGAGNMPAQLPGQLAGRLPSTPGINLADQGGFISPAILAARRAQAGLPMNTPGLPSNVQQAAGTAQPPQPKPPITIQSQGGVQTGGQQQMPSASTLDPQHASLPQNAPSSAYPWLAPNGTPGAAPNQFTQAGSAQPQQSMQQPYIPQQLMGQTQQASASTQVTPRATAATSNAITAAAPSFTNPSASSNPQNALGALGASFAPPVGSTSVANGVAPGQDTELTNSLGRSQQLQSDINSLGTNTANMTPAQQLQYQQDQAQLANEQRYQELLQMTNSQAAGTTSALNTNLAQLEGLSGAGLSSALGREQLLAQNQAGAATQNAVGRGLGNTTILDSMQRGVTNDSALRTQGLYDSANQQLYGTLSNYGNQQQNLMNTLFNQRANIIQNRTDTGPDMTAFAYLLAQAGANGGNVGTDLGGSLNTAGGSSLQQLLQSLGLAGGTSPASTGSSSQATLPNTSTPLPTNAQGVPLINGAPYYNATSIAALQQRQAQQAAPWGSAQNPAYLPGGLSSGGGQGASSSSSNSSPTINAIQSLLHQLGVSSPTSNITGGVAGMGGTYAAPGSQSTPDYNSPGMALALGANRGTPSTGSPPAPVNPASLNQDFQAPLPGDPSQETLNNYLYGASGSDYGAGQGSGAITDALMSMAPDALVSFLTAFGG